MSNRVRQGRALFIADRKEDGLAIFEGLIADVEKLKRADMDHYLRDRYPDELAAMYLLRAMALDELGKPAEARGAIPAVLKEIGTGSTPTRRFCSNGQGPPDKSPWVFAGPNTQQKASGD